MVSGLALWITAILWEADAMRHWRIAMKNPDTRSEIIRWTVNTSVVIAAAVTWLSDPNGASSLSRVLGSFRNEATTVAVTVIILEEAARHRQNQAYKAEVIRQLASRSNDFALEAARIVAQKGWHRDGSLIQGRFADANLERVTMIGAVVEGAFFHYACLVRANLAYMEAPGAGFGMADCRSANLAGAVFSGANFDHANLSNATMFHADLSGARLCRAKFDGADLTLANLTGVDLSGSTYSSSTAWPVGFDPEAAGAILIEGE